MTTDLATIRSVLAATVGSTDAAAASSTAQPRSARRPASTRESKVRALAEPGARSSDPCSLTPVTSLRSRADRAVKRATKAAVKRAKQAFHDGIESWLRRLRFDDGSGPGSGGGGLGGGFGGGAPLIA